MKKEMIPMDQCKHGVVYKIHSRNLSFGVFNNEDNGFIGIRLKFDSRFLFTEYHWDGSKSFGTVRPEAEVLPLPEGILVREREPGSFCFTCGTPATWTGGREPNGSIIPGPWVCEGGCEKTRPSTMPRNEELFAFLDGLEQGYIYSDASARDYDAYPVGPIREIYYSGMDAGAKFASDERRQA
jgi:hypothetical protein